MSYAGNFLKAAGYPCTILREVPVESYVSRRKASRSIQKGEFFWEGLILADTGLESGDILQVGDDKFLVHYVYAISGELAWNAVKTNVTLEVKRFVETVDDEGNFIQDWQTIASGITGFGEVVTAALRQADPGLLSSTKLILQIPKSYNVQQMDRVIVNGNYQVDSVDDILIQGVARLQLSEDLR
ncbi:MAG TPA: hypothetical protein GXX64_06010 [Bacteroidales bacterium]|nr:hypothetical protein [Bacteroidales bacterium]